jgi:hypothetical protein
VAGTVDLGRFWQKFAAAFAHPLTANGALSDFVSNPNITGAYAEAWVRAIVRSMLPPSLRVSTGAIIRASDSTSDLRQVPQIDLIVWDPSELPALFERDEFALVHTQSARAIIEVKRSIGEEGRCRQQLRDQQHRLLSEYWSNVLCVVISHSVPLIKVPVRPDWPSQKTSGDEPEITRLLKTGSSEADTDGIFAFIYFLSYVARHIQPPHTTYFGAGD